MTQKQACTEMRSNPFCRVSSGKQREYWKIFGVSEEKYPIVDQRMVEDVADIIANVVCPENKRLAASDSGFRLIAATDTIAENLK